MMPTIFRYGAPLQALNDSGSDIYLPVTVIPRR